MAARQQAGQSGGRRLQHRAKNAQTPPPLPGTSASAGRRRQSSSESARAGGSPTGRRWRCSGAPAKGSLILAPGPAAGLSPSAWGTGFVRGLIMSFGRPTGLDAEANFLSNADMFSKILSSHGSTLSGRRCSMEPSKPMARWSDASSSKSRRAVCFGFTNFSTDLTPDGPGAGPEKWTSKSSSVAILSMLLTRTDKFGGSSAAPSS
mmetsp:Transcript_99595/g.277266  ORF Transcript_99595/g.277266 Transcript_99595/m.277266 type:complete len:206 (-) Transcript_99595:106-723(-)